MNWFFAFLWCINLLFLFFKTPFPSKDDNTVLPTIRAMKVVETRNTDDCSRIECVYEDGVEKGTDIIQHGKEELLKPTNPTSVYKRSTTNNTPITYFLKDFGKYPKNRIVFYMIMNRI